MPSYDDRGPTEDLANCACTLPVGLDAKSRGAIEIKRRGKYEPLELHLLALPASVVDVSLSFRQIEKIIGAPLPESAVTYREWWSNQADTLNRPQAYAWTSAGFAVDTVHQDGINAWVQFKRK